MCVRARTHACLYLTPLFICLALIYCRSLILPLLPPLLLSLLAPFQTLIPHVLASITNSVAGKRLEEIQRAGFSLRSAKPNDRTGARIHKQEPGVTALGDSHSTVTLVGPIMRHDIPSSRGQKPLYRSLSLG